jgi:tRNA(Ile)-lysidine synthase TilS/MesJ
MLPKVNSTNFENMQLIRPLYYVNEDDTISWARYNELTFLDCACSVTKKNIGKRKVVKDLVSDLWEKKPKDCLKYVDNKTYEDKLIVSISKSQLDNFMAMLDELVIDYEISDLQKGLIYTNKSGNELIDISTLDLPFEPYQYQIEDAKKFLYSNKIESLKSKLKPGVTYKAVRIGKTWDGYINAITTPNPYNDISFEEYKRQDRGYCDPMRIHVFGYLPS